MKNYLIEISFYHPYPIKDEYREKAHSLPIAISRAMRNWRKDNKGKRVKQLSIKAIQL